MKRIILLCIGLLAAYFSSHAQKSSDYTTLESMVEMVGRSKSNPVVNEFRKDILKHYYKGNRQTYYNDDFSIKFSTYELGGFEVIYVSALWFSLENIDDTKHTAIKNGFQGLTGFMKQRKGERLIKKIDPNFWRDKRDENKVFANYLDHYELFFQFSHTGRLLRMAVRPKEGALSEIVKQEIAEFGPKAYVPSDIYANWNSNKSNPLYFNQIPDESCESCFDLNNKNRIIRTENGAEYKADIPRNLSISFGDEKATFIGHFYNGEASGEGKLVISEGDTIKGTWIKGFVQSVVDMQKDGFTYTGGVSRDFKMHGEGEIKQGGISCSGKFKDDNLDLTLSYTLVYENQDKYRGYIDENFEAHGKGEFTMANGETFKGEFTHGDFTGGKVNVNVGEGVTYKGETNDKNQMHGMGTLVYTNGQELKGKFSNGEFKGGTGILKYEDGSIYEGDINEKQKPSGKGKFIYTNGDFIHCITQNGKTTEASGRLTFQDGGVYEGGLNSNLQPHGAGKMVWKNGTYTEGDYINNTFAGGKGRILNSDGSYEGGLNSNLQPHGAGKMVWKNGTYAEGNFINNTFTSGKGRILYSDGSYEGGLSSGYIPNGNGKYTYKNGDYVSCVVKTGKIISGKGKRTLTDGTTYEGEFGLDLAMHGKGKVSSKDGRWYEGHFDNNKYLGGNGKITMGNGSNYSGELNAKAQAHGKGSMDFGNGYIEGRFINDNIAAGYAEITQGFRKYKGQVNSSGKPHGKGEMIWLSSIGLEAARVEGNFSHGKTTGVVELYGEGYRWRGELDSQFQPHGSGLFRDSKASDFESATFSHGKRQ